MQLSQYLFFLILETIFSLSPGSIKVETETMVRRIEYSFKDFILDFKSLEFKSFKLKGDICCGDRNAECNQVQCRLSTYAFCPPDYYRWLMDKNYDLNQNIYDLKYFYLNMPECFRTEFYISFYDPVTITFIDLELPKIKFPRTIHDLHLSNDDQTMKLHVYYTIDCDIRMGIECEHECYTTKSRERCDPITGDIMCRFLYHGKNCEEDFNPCQGNLCLNNGICIAKDGTYTCECVTGYTGKSCEFRTCRAGDCVTGTCLIGDKSCSCGSLHTSFECQRRICPAEYCFNGGACQVSGMNIWCDCTRTGAIGARCQHKCNPQCVHGDCDFKKGYPFCACHPNFFGETCTEPRATNQCPTDNPCEHGGKCLDAAENTPFICDCTPEWTGRLCEVPTCTLEVCKKGLCTHNNKCMCNKRAYGEQCQYESCTKDTICSNGGACQQSSLYEVRCSCLNNYAGIMCEHECKGGCGIYGKCQLTHLGPQCDCDETHRGADCSELIENRACQELNCLNRGICIKNRQSYTCRCNEFWTGNQCEISTCSSNTCDRGVCLMNKGCVCMEGYTGSTCSTAVCYATYCARYGICISNGKNLHCVCDNQVSTGERCELECTARCVNGECSYTSEKVPKCNCITGYRGESCDIRDYSVLISYVIGGVAALCFIILIVSILIYITAKFCFNVEGNTEDYMYRMEYAINSKEGNWNALRVG